MNSTAESPIAGFVTRKEIAEMFGVTPRTITEWSNQADGLPHCRLGHRNFYPLADVKKWVAQRVRHPNKRRSAA